MKEQNPKAKQSVGGERPAASSPTGVEQAFETIGAGKPVRVYKGSEAVRVADSADVAEGSVRIVEANGHSVGIVRVDGTLHAIRNQCPHNGAPLCRGTLSATYPPGRPYAFDGAELEGRIIACPWHGRQFDVVTGQAVYQADVSVLTYEVWEEDGGVYLRV